MSPIEVAELKEEIINNLSILNNALMLTDNNDIEIKNELLAEIKLLSNKLIELKGLSHGK